METPELSYWRSFGDFGFKLVIIGVIIEVLAAIVDFFTEKRWPACWEKWKSRLRLTEFVGGGVLIAGLAMEYKGHSEETKILDANNAILHERAATAESNNLILGSGLL